MGTSAKEMDEKLASASTESTPDDAQSQTQDVDKDKDTAATGAEAGIEIIRDSGEDAPRFTQAQMENAVRSRVAKLNRKVSATRNDAALSQDKVRELEETNKLLKLALDQKNEQLKGGPPNPDDFADGEYDPAFRKAQDEYRNVELRAEVARQVEERLKQQSSVSETSQVSAESERKQFAHYEKVKDLGATDYTDREDKAIEIFGNDVVRHMIENFRDAHMLLYYLGTEKNAEEAAHLAQLVQSNPIQAVHELGVLSAELRVKPTESNGIPEPEATLEGGSPSTTEGWQQQLETLRTKWQEGKATWEQVRDLKQRAAAAGVTLE